MKRLAGYYWKLIYDSRKWLFFVMMLASVWTFFGAVIAINFPETFESFLDFVKRIYEDIFSEIDTGSNLSLALAILQQNLKAVLLDLYLGIIFGLVPIVSVIFNFFLLGYLSGPSVYPAAFGITTISFLDFMSLILPHGIFEIPAILLAATFGTRLGWGWVLVTENRWQTLKSDFFKSLKVLPLVVLLLVVAAFIEGFITGKI